MHILLTHEQADFDAIAALLGAYLLNESALPVIPRRLNRNVRAFVNLYQTELPFVEVQYLPQGSISAVTLVDTQSLITLKGMVDNPKVHIIDHHEIREDLPLDWTLVHQPIGACTTLLVEDLANHVGYLDNIHATLLLLGIYEDTGSLSYPGTTARDIRAAAYLLDQGASLKIAGEYLNPPLSENQRRLYDKLLKSAKSFSINGQNIVIGCASARELDEEISSIAHKLRDLLELDVLFILVETREGLRLVARSTTDQVNVARVAAHFGGGGHEKAAAALIHPQELDSPGKPLDILCKKLVEILPDYVKPSITVKGIMSPHPLVLSPHTSAEEAARLMQRYGYEGYPVLKDEKVIGLLNRRAVDRAISHKLNLPVASLMEAGSVTVAPDDPIDHLQRVMSSTGWGQIPVVDPETSAIIGIVTRTDLIKIMASDSSKAQGKQNISKQLENVIPPDRLDLLKLVANHAHTHRLPVYLVGGVVRDVLLERPSTDFDIVVEGDAILLAKTLSKRYGGRVISHRRFGTAKWKIDEIRSDLIHLLNGHKVDAANLPESLDFTSSRTEFYDYPTALPTIESGSIKLDLHRRDFSINTMAVRFDGRHYGDLYDYWGGMNDLKRGIIRVLHSLSFVDDPTRVLRAVRFEQRFGFQIEERTLELIKEARLLLRQLSGERIRNELILILHEGNCIQMLNRLQDLELFEGISPELSWNEKLSEPVLTGLFDPVEKTWDLPEELGNMPANIALAFLIWLGTLPDENAKKISKRLRFSHHFFNTLTSLFQVRQLFPELVNAPKSRIVRQLDKVPRIGLYSLYIQKLSGEINQIICNYITALRFVQPHTTGEDLKRLKIKPGPVYRTILDTLRDRWLDGMIRNKNEEMHELDILLSGLKTNNPQQDNQPGK